MLRFEIASQRCPSGQRREGLVGQRPGRLPTNVNPERIAHLTTFYTRQMAGPLALRMMGYPLPSPLGWARQTSGALPLTSDRTINVVDRSAIQRSDRGAISDNATVIYRTILRARGPVFRHPAATVGRNVRPGRNYG